MRLALTFALSFALLGCASQPLPPTTAFDAHPHYPLTVIHVSPSLILRHVAGRPCHDDSTARPLIGVHDSERTYSTYELVDASGAKVFTAPSMLSDPKSAGEFQKYYRTNDQITVLTSNSKDTILIIEDRSPAYPRKAYILLRRRLGSSWAWSQIHDVPTFSRSADMGPDSTYFPDVVGLSDTNIWFSAKGKIYPPGGPSNKVNTWSQPLDATKPDARLVLHEGTES